MMHNLTQCEPFAARLARIGASMLCVGILYLFIAAPRIAFAADPVVDGCGSMYPVQPGDTLTGIAKLYHIEADEVINLNQLDDPNRIFVGQWICIPPHGMTDEQMYGSVHWSDGSDDETDYLPRRSDLPEYMQLEPMSPYSMYGVSHEAMYGSVEWSDGS